jgi:hypothetical protein
MTNWLRVVPFVIAAALCARAARAVGPCCLFDGACVELPADLCAILNGGFGGEGLTCADVTCIPFGPCCLPELVCQVRTEAECAALGGVYQGPAGECAPGQCPVTGTCCLPGGACEGHLTFAACAAIGGMYQGFESPTCFGLACFGACSFDDGSCFDGTTPNGCAVAGGNFLGTGSSCFTIDVPAIRHCIPFGFSQNDVVLFDVPQFDDQGGGRILRRVEVEFEARVVARVTLTNLGQQAIDTSVNVTESVVLEFAPLDPAPIPVVNVVTTVDCGFLLPPGATCDFGGPIVFADGLAHSKVLPAELAPYIGVATIPVIVSGSGNFTFMGAQFQLTQVPHTVEGKLTVTYFYGLPGACCFIDGTCHTLFDDECAAQGGVFIGGGVACGPGICPGACCLPDGTCLHVDESDCLAQAGLFFGVTMTCANVDCPVEEQPGWNWQDGSIVLTPDQPTYWSAATGLPAGVAPFTELDPGPFPGRPALDGTTDRVLRGFVLAWAVDDSGAEIRWNHLSASAAVVHYARSSAWEYGASAFQVVSAVAEGAFTGVLPVGRLDLNGIEYAPPYDRLLYNFQSVESSAFGPPGAPRQVISETDLTIHPVTADLRQGTGGPVATLASFDVWNQNEVKFSGARRCVTCWDRTPLRRYDAPNHFLRQHLQTDHGTARIRGLASPSCPNSVAASILGVSASRLRFDPGMANEDFATAGGNLFGTGTGVATITVDAGPAPSVPDGDGAGGPQDKVSATERGSLLIISNVELRWSGQPPFALEQDTIISLTNDGGSAVRVRFFLVNGDPPVVP